MPFFLSHFSCSPLKSHTLPIVSVVFTPLRAGEGEYGYSPFLAREAFPLRRNGKLS